FAVVGVATEERQLRVTFGEGLPGVAATAGAAAPAGSAVHGDPSDIRPVDVPIDVILGKPPRMTRDVTRTQAYVSDLDLTGINLEEAMTRVLRHPTVANQNFLITIGDRSVGGLSSRDQMVGPWQVHIADCAVTLADYESVRGE